MIISWYSSRTTRIPFPGFFFLVHILHIFSLSLSFVLLSIGYILLLPLHYSNLYVFQPEFFSFGNTPLWYFFYFFFYLFRISSMFFSLIVLSNISLYDKIYKYITYISYGSVKLAIYNTSLWRIELIINLFHIWWENSQNIFSKASLFEWEIHKCHPR